MSNAPAANEAAPVSFHKHESLVRHAQDQEQQIANLRHELADRYSLQQKDVWYWQGDGEDHPATLSCSVLIQANDLRALIAGTPAQIAALELAKTKAEGLLAFLSGQGNDDQAKAASELLELLAGLKEAPALATNTETKVGA